VFGEIRGGGPVWDVESGGTVCVLVADCQWPQSGACLKPETMRVTFEEFSPTHDFFDYRTFIFGPSFSSPNQTGFIYLDAATTRYASRHILRFLFVPNFFDVRPIIPCVR
jgi:hypothetical protein